MRWTREMPTEPGWYWVRDPDVYATSINLVQHAKGRLMFAYGSGVRIELDDAMYDDCEWAGPIPEPGE